MTFLPLVGRAASLDHGRMSWFLDVLDRLREANAAQVRLHERMALRRQPWLEEFLHWSFDGQEWQLHGHLLPPGDGHLLSVTSDGWCPRQQGTVTE